ncbi:MAG: NADH:ubiquinone reductase (Na(+)-transporting) subunit F [Bacteroidales bacterium]|nr:NADH:ubiquinone reductase (Na(+)-transporting) subunit F [Bacteroidales bacterium]MDD2205526.1 NADH:ubiquinone reductase (Na(+)-transporting) subunit F [Bacteroidales bacterium]MDD3152462.1 NADH:ubiquinone reductase (Na(+)-transporting) subunit F [Bacteroidales bacterium]MDD3914470.1 NADH:ubiquinone reductase (Na(+)-transporting) subunit F [Bacteroidales bacterium]MDD4634298.1 NADH:ubiquinone reductase (Na(+)-transporting) subunit F [Bacteroidales bacterium]
MTTLLIALIIFFSIIWILLAILLFARKKLVPEGNVKIHINEEKDIQHERGCSLLQALGDEHIFMPSACGGGGTCGTCKGRVLSGGGSILPTEKTLINKKLQEDNYRLFCQVKVREDMSIEIPKEVFGVKKWECEVISNHNVATYIKELVVKLPEDDKIDFRSGGYIQVDVPKCCINYKDFIIDNEYINDWQRMNFFNLVMKNGEHTSRAYSMANHPQENDRIMLNVRIATPPFDKSKGTLMNVNPGICSSYLYSLKAGDKVNISGPYGEFFLHDSNNEMMFIGGGAGMAPMRSHIFDLFKTQHTKRKVTFWYGGRSVRELFYVNDFEEIAHNNDNFNFNIALSDPLAEDKWTGYTGFIHEVIYENYLKAHKYPEDIEYYICGPPLMLKAVLKMLDNLGVDENMIFYDDFGG